MTRTILASLLGLALALPAAAQGQYDPRFQQPPPQQGQPYPDQRGYPQDGRPYRDDRGYAEENVNFAYADVLRADPIYETIREPPREECYDERVVQQEPHGGNPTGGTILGAIIGGALGNQVGKGDGRKAATVAGAVIGGAVGNNVDRNNGPGRSYETTQRRCQPVDGGGERREIVGYDVEYRYRGDVYMSRLDYNPG
jgi:uncharacterized protein YcfJ